MDIKIYQAMVDIAAALATTNISFWGIFWEDGNIVVVLHICLFIFTLCLI